MSPAGKAFSLRRRCPRKGADEVLPRPEFARDRQVTQLGTAHLISLKGKPLGKSSTVPLDKSFRMGYHSKVVSYG